MESFSLPSPSPPLIDDPKLVDEMNKPVKGKDSGSVKLEEKEIDEDEDDKDEEDVENSSPYQSKMEEHVCDAIPLKEMVNQGQITHVYTVDINHGIHGKANLVTNPNASFDPALRMKKLNADLRTFQNGYLPLDSNGTGIFIRHDEDDPAYMKCLITGPEDTPYSWGLFEFDIFIPPNYPDKPPKFTHRTTNNGTIRFNPNLYSNGYVCLSLLGTWDGPSWDPKVGSMIQVLNSLQALVLVDDPYYNEPGTSPSRDKVSSEQYKHMVREATLRHAIAGHLQNPSPIWKSVILDHFKLVKAHIYKLAAKWVEEAPEVAKPCSYGDVGCKGIRSTMKEAYRLVQQSFDKLNIVKFLNDFESKYYPVDGEDYDEEDYNETDEEEEEDMEEKKEEIDDMIDVTDLSISLSKKQFKSLSPENRQKRKEVEEKEYMKILFQLCKKDLSFLRMLPERLQKDEDFLKALFAVNCHVLEHVHQADVAIRLLESLTIPKDQIEITFQPDPTTSKKTSNNNDTFNFGGFGGSSPFGGTMGTPVISNSTYAFDYIENVDDNDENGNMIKQIDYATFHKEHPNQKVAIFKNYDGVTYKRLTNAQFNQIKNGNPESITFPDTPSSSTSSEGNENSVKAAYRYYEAKVKGSSGISIEDSPELSPQNIFGGNANTRILNFNTTGLQVLCEVEDKHKKHKLVKSGRRVMIALHNIIIGYASMHTSDNYQLIEITDPSYEQKKNLKEQAKKEKEQAKKVNEQKKDIIKPEKEISLSSTVSSSSNEKHSSLGHTLLELQSEGLNDMDLVKDFVLYQNVDKDTETYWLPNESLLKYVNTGLRDNLEFYTAFLQKINEMEELQEYSSKMPKEELKTEGPDDDMQIYIDNELYKEIGGPKDNTRQDIKGEVREEKVDEQPKIKCIECPSCNFPLVEASEKTLDQYSVTSINNAYGGPTKAYLCSECPFGYQKAGKAAFFKCPRHDLAKSTDSNSNSKNKEETVTTFCSQYRVCLSCYMKKQTKLISAPVITKEKISTEVREENNNLKNGNEDLVVFQFQPAENHRGTIVNVSGGLLDSENKNDAVDNSNPNEGIYFNHDTTKKMSEKFPLTSKSLTFVEVGMKNLDSLGNELINILSDEVHKKKAVDIKNKDGSCDKNQTNIDMNLVVIDPNFRVLQSKSKKNLTKSPMNQMAKLVLNPYANSSSTKIDEVKNELKSETDINEDGFYKENYRPDQGDNRVEGKYYVSIELQVPCRANPYKDIESKKEFITSDDDTTTEDMTCVDKFQVIVDDTSKMTQIMSYCVTRFTRKLWLIKHLRDSKFFEKKEPKLEEFEKISSSVPSMDQNFVEECKRNSGFLHFKAFLDGTEQKIDSIDDNDTAYDWSLIPNSDHLIIRLKEGSSLTKSVFPLNNPFTFTSVSSSPFGTSVSSSPFGTAPNNVQPFTFGKPSVTGTQKVDNKLEKKFEKKAPETIPCLYEDDYYSGDEDTYYACEMVKLLTVDDGSRMCDICEGDLKGGHYSCEVHDKDLCAQCFFDQSEYDDNDDEVDDQDDDDNNNKEKEESASASKTTDELENIPCYVMNPLRKVDPSKKIQQPEKEDENRNKTRRQEMDFEVPPPSNVSTAVFSSRKEETLKEVDLYTYPSQMSLATDMLVNWDELAMYEMGKKNRVTTVSNNGQAYTQNFKNLNAMFKRHVLLSFLYQSFSDAKVEFDEHNRSCSNEETNLNNDSQDIDDQPKEKRSLFEDFNSNIIDLKSFREEDLSNGDTVKSKEQTKDETKDINRKNDGIKVDLSHFSLNLNIVFFDGIDDYIQATSIDPSLRASNIRLPNALELHNYFTTSVGPNQMAFNYPGSQTIKTETSNHLDVSFLSSKILFKEALDSRLISVFEKKNGANSQNFGFGGGSSTSSDNILMPQISVTLHSLSKTLKIGGSMQYGIQLKQKQSTTNTSVSHNVSHNISHNVYDTVKNACMNNNPTNAKWFDSGSSSGGSFSPFSSNPQQFSPPPFFGSFAPQNPPQVSPFGVNPSGGKVGGLGGVSDQKEKESQKLVKKVMTFEDKYRLSPVTKFLGFIEISRSIYPMYNFHQCFDSNKLVNPFNGPTMTVELRNLLSINNISQTLKEKFFMNEFIKRENKDGVMEEVCIIEVINDDLDKLCALLEKRQRERENDGNYDESKPLWTNNADEDNEAGLLHPKSKAFLEFLLMSLESLDNFKRYKVINGSFIHL